MRISLRQRLGLIGIALLSGSLYGILNRQAILSNSPPNPTDFTALLLAIFQTEVLIDCLASIPLLGLVIIGAASQSIGVFIGLIVLDHRTAPVAAIVSLSMIAGFEVTAQVLAGLGGFRLADFFDKNLPNEYHRGANLNYYATMLGLALSISCLSALFETASILGMLPFGL